MSAGKRVCACCSNVAIAGKLLCAQCKEHAQELEHVRLGLGRDTVVIQGRTHGKTLALAFTGTALA